MAATPDRRVTLLASTTLAGAVTGQASTPVTGLQGARYLVVEVIFVRAGGGTSAALYVQTSLDGGVTWIDIACAKFLVTTKSSIFAVRVDPATPLTAATVPTDGSLTDDTVLNGVIGDQIRTKLTTVGIYTGASSIEAHMVTKGG